MNPTSDELTKSILSTFAPILRSMVCNKGQILHEENTICNELFLVKRGILRAYYHLEGRDITAHFALENDAITAPDGFISRKRSRYNIEVLESGEVWVVNHHDLEEFLEEHAAYERLARKFTEQIYMDLLERVEGLVFWSAREKYEALVEKYPRITQRVNLGHIASYLNITQETLSRIRKPSL